MIRKKRTSLKIVGKQIITLNGQNVAYVVKRSNRARYIRLEIRPGADLTAVIPEFYDPAILPDFLESKQNWILTKLKQYSRRKAPLSGNKPIIKDSMPYLGKNLKIVRQRDKGTVENISFIRNKLVINSRCDNGRLNKALEKWYRLQAEKIIGAKVQLFGDKLDLAYNRLTIRGQKTLWGSCSRKGNLNFNWKLVMLPEPVIDYVVIHELMHLAEMNHSKRFWNLVADKCPDWKKHRKYLKDYSIILSSKLY